MMIYGGGMALLDDIGDDATLLRGMTIIYFDGMPMPSIYFRDAFTPRDR